MRINLLKNGYLDNKKNGENEVTLRIYKDFLNDNISIENEYFSDDYIIIDSAPNFPIYMAPRIKGDIAAMYTEAVVTLMNNYISLDRSIHLNGNFWHSLLLLKKRDYILERYSDYLTDYNDFKNIVLKKLDWENYIYKCVLIAEYLKDSEILRSMNDVEPFVYLIFENRDLLNYFMKTRLFRNSDFFIKFFMIIYQEKLTEIMKAGLPYEQAKGKDLRYGRLVISELNHSYPVINPHALSIEELTTVIKNILRKLDAI